MSENKAGYANVNPNSLLTTIARPRMTLSFIVSLLVHVILLGVCSVGFIQQAIAYKTIHPKAAIKEEQKLRAKEEEERKKEEALKLAQLKANEEAEKAAAEEAKNPKKAEPAAAKPDAKTTGKDGKAEDTRNDYQKELETPISPTEAVNFGVTEVPI